MELSHHLSLRNCHNHKLLLILLFGQILRELVSRLLYLKPISHKTRGQPERAPKADVCPLIKKETLNPKYTLFLQSPWPQRQFPEIGPYEESTEHKEQTRTIILAAGGRVIKAQKMARLLNLPGLALHLNIQKVVQKHPCQRACLVHYSLEDRYTIKIDIKTVSIIIPNSKESIGIYKQVDRCLLVRKGCNK